MIIILSTVSIQSSFTRSPLLLVSVRRGYTSFRCTLSFAMNYGSTDHFRILQLLIQAGAFLNVSNHDELLQFLTFRKRKKRGLMSSYDVVQRMMKKEFDDVEKEIVCPLEVMKCLIQHNALLPKNWDKGETFHKDQIILKYFEISLQLT